MKKYEYLILYGADEQLLNGYGLDNWELVSVVSTTGSYMFILKRELNDK